MLSLKGSTVALVTPFNEDGSINFDKIGQLIDWHLEQGTDAILVLGTTGESAALTHEEDCAVCEFAVKRIAGRVPLIAGSGSNCTSEMMRNSLAYQRLGADGLLMISPYYVKTNNEGMYHHFADVADAVDIPCILYNVPGRTGCSIPVDVVRRLAKHKNIVGIKEASGDLAYACKIAQLISPEFEMYCGNDDIIVPLMSLGAAGVITVLGNVAPRVTHDIVAKFHAGDIEGSRRLQLQYLNLVDALFIEVNPIPVKAAMNLLGLGVGGYRLPLYPMSSANHAVLESVMKESGLI